MAGHDPFGDFRPPVTNLYGSVPMTDPADAARPEGLLTEEEWEAALQRIFRDGYSPEMADALLADRAARQRVEGELRAECERLRGLCREAAASVLLYAEALEVDGEDQASAYQRGIIAALRAAATGGAHGR